MGRTVKRFFLYVFFGSLAPLVLVALVVNRRLAPVLGAVGAWIANHVGQASRSVGDERDKWTRNVGVLEVIEWFLDRN